ncbi:hypothetical protein N0V83_008157 [Neocucurbitaria cava]|uniref:J domain-containing protein n=1 Tax=Neocucurbitaria cava TaxID=798079 RepID=A0A9W8Y244_9PLEO|nr:hypothetical protein N0V83_008157 [Neocucurbitaria cava]
MATTNPKPDYYAILEVRPGATHDEIKASYRRLARVHHPDKNDGARSSTIKTQQEKVSHLDSIYVEVQQLNGAWEVLGDSGRRAAYDRSRPAQTTARPPPPPPQQQQQAPPASQPAQEEEESEESRAERASRERREWLTWEKAQEEAIAQCQAGMVASEAEIAALAAANDPAIRLKRVLLGCQKSRLDWLLKTLAQRRVQEDVRLRVEREEEVSRERAARERSQRGAGR